MEQAGMKREEFSNAASPDVAQLRRELKRVRRRKARWGALGNLMYTLAVASAVAVLVAILALPILQIYGNSMTPTLSEGDFVVSVKGSDFQPGDLVVFYREYLGPAEKAGPFSFLCSLLPLFPVSNCSESDM